MIPTDMARDPTASPPPPRGEGPACWTVIYDGECGFCRWSLATLLALDRDAVIAPLALGTPEADALLSDLPPQTRAASWHLVSPDGARVSAGAAAAPLLRLLSGGRLPAAALAAAPGPTERAYRWVADHRSTLSRWIPARAKRRATERIRRHGGREPRD